MKKQILIASLLLSVFTVESAQAGQCYIQLYLNKGRACFDPNGSLVTSQTSIFDPNLATAQNGYNKYAYVSSFTDNAYSPTSAFSPESCVRRAKDWLDYCVGKNASLRVTGEVANAVYLRNDTVILIGSYTYGSPLVKYVTNDNGGWEQSK